MKYLLTKDASKLEEIEHLTSFADGIEKGAYLADLFHPELIAWATERIKNDWTLNLIGEYNAAVKDASDDAARLAEVEHRHQLDLQTQQEQIETLQKIVHQKDEVIDNRQTQIDNLNTYSNKVERELYEARVQLEAQQLEIIRLKAEVYDLTRKEQ